MATLKEELEWKLFVKRREKLLYYGFKSGLIIPYFKSENIMNRFRDTYFGGIPLSIYLLSKTLCNHKCYDRALLVALAYHDIDKVTMVDADVDGIRLNPGTIDEYRNANGYLPEHYGNHCFTEVTDEDGITWVFDTTDGIVMEKSLYYKIERPKITKVNHKEDIVNYFEYQEILHADKLRDRYALPLLIPMIEDIARVELSEDKLNATALLDEIKLFKEQVGYEDIVKEDMKQKKII